MHRNATVIGLALHDQAHTRDDRPTRRARTYETRKEEACPTIPGCPSASSTSIF